MARTIAVKEYAPDGSSRIGSPITLSPEEDAAVDRAELFAAFVANPTPTPREITVVIRALLVEFAGCADSAEPPSV